MIVPTSLILSSFLLVDGVDRASAFQTHGVGRQGQVGPHCRLSVHTVKFTLQDHEFLGGGGSDFETVGRAPSDDDIFKSLSGRQKALRHGIGKRYVARTQRGFLNVHYEPSDPFDTSNVISQLNEGQVVTSTGPPRGYWIPHDAGGWSIAKHGGFTWLEPIDE